MDIDMSLDSLKDLSGFDFKQGFSTCMNDESLYLSIVQMYIVQLEEDLPKLQTAFDDQQWIEVGKVCHGIKGASASVGATDMQEASANLELAGKNEDGQSIKDNFPVYIEMLKSTASAIQQAL